MLTDRFRLFMRVCSEQLEEACLLRSNSHLGCTHRLRVFLPSFLLSDFCLYAQFHTGGLLFVAS